MDIRDLHIGLTYDLRADYEGQGLSEESLAEFDSPATIEALEGALLELGQRPERVGNIQALAARLVAGQRFDLVFNIAEGRFGIGRESQVPALLDAYGIPSTFSDPLVCALTLHKATAKRVLRDFGLPTPGFLLVESLQDLERIDLVPPLFAKPVAEGTSKGIDGTSIVRSLTDLPAVCERLLARFEQPVLVEEFLPGREFTVGILGSGLRARAVGTLEVELLDGADPLVYTFRNKEDCEHLVRYRLADDAPASHSAELALATWRALGCRDGGRVDLRLDASGRPQVIEVNPLPGMHPSHSDLPILWQLGGRSYQELVGQILESALERLPAGGRHPWTS